MRNLIEQFLFDKQYGGVSPRTVKWYKDKISRYVDFMEQHEEIAPYLLVEFMNSLECSDETKAGYARAIRAFHSWAEDHDVENIARKFKPRFPAKPRRNVMPRDLIEKLIYSINTSKYKNYRNMVFFLFAYHTGCRRGEILKLRKEDIDINNQIASVVGKGNKARFVPLSTELCVHLIDYMNMLPGAYLFIAANRDGDPSDKDVPVEGGHFSNKWTELQRENGIQIPWNLHKLRNACATHLSDAGIDLSSIQALLGHSDPQMTRRYAQMSCARIKNDTAKVFG